jgi:rubrerythrin
MFTTLKRRGVAFAAALVIAGATSGCIGTASSDSAPAPAPRATAEATVIANLQTAFNGENNAGARYLAFAKQADAEGYGKVARLFRAAAKAETIHAANHAGVLRQLGVEAKADVKEPEVKTTIENLRTALAGEIAERDTMYPGYLKQARDAGNARAARTFKLAQAAEAEHAKLYQQAIDDLASWKGGPQTFYVCTICGFTSATPLEACPSCYSPKKLIAEVK